MEHVVCFLTFCSVGSAQRMPKDRPPEIRHRSDQAVTCIRGRRLKRRTWALNAEHLLEGEEFPVRNSKGVYPGIGTPCVGAGIDLLNFLHMRAGLMVKPVHSLVFMRIDQEPERLTIAKGFVATKRS